MKYAVKMGSGVNDIHTKFHKDLFTHSKVYGRRGYTDTDSTVISYVYFYFFFKIRKVGKKKNLVKITPTGLEVRDKRKNSFCFTVSKNVRHGKCVVDIMCFSFLYVCSKYFRSIKYLARYSKYARRNAGLHESVHYCCWF
jgi:hypothetical protein